MADRVASVAGDWSSSETWGGNAPPGDGDTATINVAVTVDADVTVGESGAEGTVAVTIAHPGVLTIGDDVSLRVRGCLLVGGSQTTNRLILGPGSEVIFDATQADEGVQYYLQVGLGVNHRPMVYCRATAENHATISSDTTSGALPAYCRNASLNGQGQIDAEYLDFTDFGDATNRAWVPHLGITSTKFRLVDCTFTRCGRVAISGTQTADAIFEMDGVKFVDSADTVNLSFGTSVAMTTGTRSITGCVFDQSVSMFTPRDFTITSNYFHAGFSTSVPPAAAWAEFGRNFIRDVDQPGQGLAGDISDCFYYKDVPGESNPHGLACGLDADVTFDGVIIESVSGQGGDLLFPSGPANPRTTTVQNCILLPIAGGATPPGKILSILGNGTNTTLVFEHNTYPVSDEIETGCWVGESSTAVKPGLIESFQSNLAWRPTAGEGGYKFVRWITTVQDILDADATGHNGGWNLAEGSEGGGYHCSVTSTAMVSTGTLGAGDVSGDPLFVDRTRNLSKWAVDERGSVAEATDGQQDDALAALMADPGLIDDLLAYVREGFRPQSSSYATAGHDGATIGAVAASAAPATSVYLIQPPGGGFLIFDAT